MSEFIYNPTCLHAWEEHKTLGRAAWDIRASTGMVKIGPSNLQQQPAITTCNNNPLLQLMVDAGWTVIFLNFSKHTKLFSIAQAWSWEAQRDLVPIGGCLGFGKLGSDWVWDWNGTRAWQLDLRYNFVKLQGRLRFNFSKYLSINPLMLVVDIQPPSFQISKSCKNF